MNVPAKLAAFALGLVACFGIGLGIGVAVGPIDDGASQPTHTGTHTPATTMPMPGDTTGH
jgi:hypothetical protein